MEKIKYLLFVILGGVRISVVIDVKFVGKHQRAIKFRPVMTKIIHDQIL